MTTTSILPENQTPNKIRDHITEHISRTPDSRVDVQHVIDTLVKNATVELQVTSNTHTDTSTQPPDALIDAAWTVVENYTEYMDWSYTNRIHVVSVLTEQYDISEEFLVEDHRVRYGQTWDMITESLCEYALYQVVHGIINNDFDKHLDEYDTSGTMLDNQTVHEWVTDLADDVSKLQPNGTSIVTPETVQALMTDIDSGDHAVLEVDNPVTIASVLDSFTQLYGMTGNQSIESEQLAASVANDTWDTAITTGIASHAIVHAIALHNTVISPNK